MRRSMLAFEEQGLHPIASPSALVSDVSRRNSLMPSELWLRVGDAAVYEWIASAYYRVQGWTATR